MTELRLLLNKRANVKGQMTRIKTSLELTAAEAQIRAQKIEEYFSKFEEVQTAIEELKLESERASEGDEATERIQRDSEAERTVFESVYYAAAAKARAIIDAANGEQQMPQQQNNSFPTERGLQIKLPTLKIPEFHGNYDQWLLFKETFTSMIHERAGLSPIQKFQYLRSALTDEALQVIGVLKTTAENYAHAWELLTKNYENTKLLINTHLNQLLDFPEVAKDKPATIKQLIVHIRTHLKALKTLKLPVDHWDELLVHLIKGKLDYSTQKDWEEETNRDKVKEPTRRPTLEEFLTFLSERCRTLEMIEKGKSKQDKSKLLTIRKSEKKVTLASTSQRGCVICGEAHTVYQCPQFLQLPVASRMDEAKSKRMCLNCLGKGHFAGTCKSSTCRKCSKKHNTLLHMEQESKPETGQASSEDSSKNSVVATCTKENLPNPKGSSSVINFARRPTSHVILSTAQVNIEDADGKLRSCRVLLDPGSQSNLISEELVRRLKIKGKRSNELITGINKSRTNVAMTADVKIKSMHVDYEAAITCLILPSITEQLPQVKINSKLIYVPEGLQLADPNFHEPGTVDLLVGAGLFWKILCPDAIKQKRGTPKLQNTLLGWIVGGELIDARSHPPQFCGIITNTALEKQVERFWNQEEPNETRCLTLEEAECERQFAESVRRDDTGRYIVALPKKPEVNLGDSENQAVRRLYALERRFRVNPEIKSEYVKFMKGYEEQGHMSLVSEGSSTKQQDLYILPHQAVIKPDSVTTKVRVVFDASAKTTNGMALNDKLLIGPNLQRDLFEIILRFRAHEFVITADIEAMFRQIIVQEEDRDLQTILWRNEPAEPIRKYRLNTVTYGTASAPYLAIRCLRQLAEDEREFPLASRALREDFYMDDVLTGTSTIEEAKVLQQQLSQLLQRGRFHLRKWRSNNQRVLEGLTNVTEVDNLLKIDKEGALKTLGLLWDAGADAMQYQVEIEGMPKITKRLVLSKIAQIFDPLGLLGPVIIRAKCIMQQMWQLKTGWDEPLTQNLQTKWLQYYSSLPGINEVRIDRNVNRGNIEPKFDLIGFGDASEAAYGACLYAVSQNERGEMQSHLISSKSRVAPLKTVSLPRLELNAALLLAKLCKTARIAFGDKIRSVHLWSDSTIALSWIATSPNIRQTYVANRVAKIQELSQEAAWHHVRSEENPADLISRGITVEDWRDNKLWWHGPSWLATGQWPQQKEIEIDTSEMRATAVLLNTEAKSDLLERFSSIERLQRVIAYCLRFKTNALEGKRKGPLSVKELKTAEISIARMTQRESFSSELRALEKEHQVSKNSKLATLSPYLDKDGLIRVGGRLSRADIPEEEKHPIVLPAKHNITKLVVRREHLRLHHCGAEQLLHSVRQRYWPLSGRRETRKVTRTCLQCFRRTPRMPEVIMGDLPSYRVSGCARPFTNVGVDYAGPLQVRESRRRGRVHSSKAWIAVFTCFATKAVHLELVTELTTQAFLAALRRFVARRGVCSRISSDNGTNFVGAARELKEVYEFLKTQQIEISDHLARQRIEWDFIPPRAPHFGGLWEAAVKSTKRHLNTVTEGLVSTFEEYYTLLVEIESILNSRPLTPLSSDPSDLSVLTPAHFLVGDTLLLPVEHDYQGVAETRLSRWQHLQRVRQHFWTRWHREYLQELQKRQKWFSKGRNIETGALVLLKEDHVSPLHWVLGRVVEVHPGSDNVVRVVTVRTPTGVYKRAVKYLCPLPTEEDDLA